MRIVITDERYIEDRFAKWLVSEIKMELIQVFDGDYLQVFSDYLFEKFNIVIDIYEAFFKILESIVYSKGNGSLQIMIDSRDICMGAPITTVSLAKLIDVGNMEIRGTHIFTDVFNGVSKDLDKYFIKYMLENGGM
jgi:hypothetical protein